MCTNKIFLAGLFAWCVASGASATGILTGPDEIPLSGTLYSFSKVPFELEFRWEEEDPLKLNLYLIEKRLKAGGSFVTFTFKDASGKQAELGDLLGTYIPPTGDVLIFKGQSIKIGLWGHGWVTVMPGTKYTLTAELRGWVNDHLACIRSSKEVIFVKAPSEEKERNQTTDNLQGATPTVSEP